MTSIFSSKDLEKLYISPTNSSKGQNGQVTIIGGSHLFHGAPLFSLTVASRIVDMTFFSSPETSLEKVADKIKSKLLSFIWVPWKEIDEYIEKSDAVLIGPGLLRYKNANSGSNTKNLDIEGSETKEITERLVTKFPNKKWVIDAGSLQVINPGKIPAMAIVTPNQKEYQMVFGKADPKEAARKYNCVIVLKGVVTRVFSPDDEIEITGGNPGLTKGGSGDVEAGLTVALLAKNDPFLAASASAYVVKKSADLLFEKVGNYYNSDDLANKIPEVLSQKE